MSNPYLPKWEYIPDGEPRVFNNRVYVYGSHDRVASEDFCDFKLKVWSASVDNLNDWTCHGDAFHTKADKNHESDTADWSDKELYAPDVVEKDGKYYLYAYVVHSRGCVAVSDYPEGPFQLISQYQVPDNGTSPLEKDLEEGIFIDPGVLVDDDGQVYIYCGYLHSFMAQINPDNMYEIIDGYYKRDIIPEEEPYAFFEACSPRKVGDTYYMIYSPKCGSRLVYATSDSPKGPFKYRGVIVDNGVEYPGGNNHGSICKIKDQWYIFYHRMTNNSVMSRRACVEKIEMLEDGTIPQVEMTSLGFEESLSPYKETEAEIACVLKGGGIISEKNVMERPIVNILPGSVIGYKYFDFGQDYSSTSMWAFIKINGSGQKGIIYIHLDSEDGTVVGQGEITTDSGILKIPVANITGRHSIFFTFETGRKGWMKENFEGRELCQMVSFVFCK
ncbi:family 43 glycosylhydrolase [Lachnospiraceae bacterium OttesenSCG-928-D06]|nr:family 43 glycosylhydrolase [Lachnospiraceae bacterium OttesenSCG-928-D06]